MLKLLIVKTSSLGDIVHNLPIIADIREYYPDAEIDWLVESNFVDIPQMHPGVNNVIPIDMRRWRNALFDLDTWSEINALRKKLSKSHYDVILDTQGLLKSGLMVYFCSGRKHGYDQDSIREPVASYFYDTQHSVSQELHAVERNRTLAALALRYPTPKEPPVYLPQNNLALSDLALSPESVEYLTSKPYVIGLHGSSRESKLWPVVHWIVLGNQLAEIGINLILPWANTAEHYRAQHIAKALKNAMILPEFSIEELAPIMRGARAAIGVDTGLSHLAVALNVPTVAIYTDTNPAKTGLYAGNKTSVANLGGIKQTPAVNQVFNAFLSLSKDR